MFRPGKMENENNNSLLNVTHPVNTAFFRLLDFAILEKDTA